MFNPSPEFIAKTVENIARMPPAQAARSIKGFAAMNKDLKAGLAKWAMLPDGQLVAALSKEAQAFPMLLPLCQNARPEWIIAVGHELRGKQSRGL